MKKYTFIFIAALLLPACQHGISPSETESPPELDDSGVVASTLSPEEIEKQLQEIAETPYPPYTLTGGDIFRISVYNEEDLVRDGNVATVITPDGYLNVSMVGPVLVRNMTMVEATEAVRSALSKFIRYPEISLQPQLIQGKLATLFGAVKDPGNYLVNEHVKLADFISMGKGYARGILDDDTVDLADINNSYVIRDGKVLPVNFNEAIVKGNPLHNIKIFPGDLVYVAQKETSRVTIIGEVREPCRMNWSSGVTIMDAISYARGLTEDYWGSALILRKSKETGALKVYKVNVDDLIAGRIRNPRLASGDIVYIPRDDLSEYNVFIRKLMPTAQFINLIMSPITQMYRK